MDTRTFGNHFTDVVASLGGKQEYFPGTGGNVSYKTDDGVMFIKASGKRISHMNEEDGVVPLMYSDVKEYFHATQKHEDGEKESSDLILSLVHSEAQGRPSIETGFHTLLSNAVIHSHSAYVNMLACSRTFETSIDTLFLGSHIPYMSIGYAKPGYYLTHIFLDKVKKLSSRPKVIFMKNHGVVVSADTLEDAIRLHEDVNTVIKKYFGFTDSMYPKGNLVHLHDMCSVSNTAFLQEFVKNNVTIFEHINDYILFPDLTVFCQDIVVTSDTSADAKIVINKHTGKIVYKTSKKEAHCIEENLIAFAFLMTYMKEHNLQPVYISKEDADSIRNMEEEKYRKRLLER
jgi:ribulose-5-phosphate 4-epimerase/fuculose-1-phosphate aldolase